MEKVKNIVYAGTKQGWAYNNILGQILFAIATEEEAEILFICGDDSFPELTAKAEELYEQYREKYYEEMFGGSA